MNTKSILILIFLFVVNLSFAQTDNQDVIYTNDGSIFRGDIVKIDEDKSIDLQIKNGLIVHFKHSEIQKIVQESNGTEIIELQKPYNFKEKGVFFASSFCPNFGSSSWGAALIGVGLHQVVGYQMNRWMGIGAGFGIDSYEIGSERSFIPLYIQARGYFTTNNVAPYYAVDLGYGFARDTRDVITESHGGRFFYPSLGYRFGAKKGGNFTIDFGVKFQKGTFKREWGRGRSDIRDLDFQRFAFRFGWLF